MSLPANDWPSRKVAYEGFAVALIKADKTGLMSFQSKSTYGLPSFSKCGVYAIFDASDVMVYVGIAHTQAIGSRVWSHTQPTSEGDFLQKLKRSGNLGMDQDPNKYHVRCMAYTNQDINLLEHYLIACFRPRLNA